MISQSFKNSISHSLKENYGIDLVKIKKLSSKGYLYQDFNLYGKSEGLSHIFRLRINFCDDDAEDYRRSFYIFTEAHSYFSSFKTIRDKIHPLLINNAILDVKKLFSFLDLTYTYSLRHLKVSLVSGTYTHSTNGLVVNTIQGIVETTSVISVYVSFSEDDFCIVNIIGNKISVRPSNGYTTELAFQGSSTIDKDGIDSFKAGFAKCFLIYINKKLDGRYNHQEDDYMSLTYDELKRYFLVLEMEKI